jgi:MFS family permease
MMAGAGVPTAATRSARLAVTAVFVVNGLLFASWTAHIPHVKAQLGLSDGTLGFALLGAPVGSVLAMVASSYLLPRWGSQRVVQITLVGYCAAGPLVGLTGSPIALFAALLLWGAFQGALDVSMNAQAITVERQVGRATMSGLHGAWSIASFAGAGIGAGAVAAGIALSPQLLVLGAVAVLVGGLWTVRLLPDPPATHLDGPRGPASRWSGGMVVLAAVAAASMLCEGASADWGAVYLSGSLHTSAGAAGLAYAAFSLGMVSVRLAGNRLLTRYPAHRLLPALAALGTVGIGAGLASGAAVGALIGFVFLGIGLSLVVPTVFSAAGNIAGLHPGTAVATVSACGWFGFVCGPPLIGHLADLTTLPIALTLLPVLSAFVVIGTRTARALRTA